MLIPLTQPGGCPVTTSRSRLEEAAWNRQGVLQRRLSQSSAGHVARLRNTGSSSASNRS